MSATSLPNFGSRRPVNPLLGGARRPRLASFALALAAVAILAEARTASAQVNVLPGQRIRATMSNGGLVIGTVVSVASDSLTINTGASLGTGFMGFNQPTFTPGASNIKMPIDQIRMIEISRGRVSGLKTGAMYGLAGGGILGTLGGAASCGADCAVVGAIYGALAGAGNGLWIGHFFLSGERWVAQYGGVTSAAGRAASPNGRVVQIGARRSVW